MDVAKLEEPTGSVLTVIIDKDFRGGPPRPLLRIPRSLLAKYCHGLAALPERKANLTEPHSQS